ncbi:hypothetical protein DVA86_14670 [Streptomyces armeniacus]|uniref:Uncharacterized protein n=1 Tax=Streptomyces armeniacus TaxID=83291 RepID=A0A345XPZ8_9ACTN|nr:hypothetical protein [Streptomyces armeniacus]AXK33714.1 hypothetical protein DVA86_14670 [Streptomyces armeniacus]
MPDEVGGQPFPDGEEPDDRHHGEADDEFASVVFDEHFVRSAEVHEPTAVERILAAAQSHAETETNRPYDDRYGYGPGGEGEFDPDDPDGPDIPDGPDGRDGPGRRRITYGEYDDYLPGYGYGGYGFGGYGSYGHDPAYEHGADFGYPYGPHDGPPPPYRGHARWQRPVAWVLAVVMGIGVVALAFAAVYRGASSQRQDPSPPPATSGVGSAPAPDERERVSPGALPSASQGAPAGAEAG